MAQPATTFALLRQHGACENGYRKLAKHLGGVTEYGRDKPILLTVILDSSGLDDTLWCLRALVEPWDRKLRLYAADCAKRHESCVYLNTPAGKAAYHTAFQAWKAARAAVRLTDKDAELDWQAKRLRQYLTGKARPLKRAA